MTTLYLHEEILLLALRDKKGTIDHRAGRFLHVIAGAILAELMLAEKINLDGKRHKLINVVDPTSAAEPILDEVLQQMVDARRRKSIQAWVRQIALVSKLKQRTATGLCDKGILRKEEAKVLWLFKTIRYPELDPKPERALLGRIEAAIFSSHAEVDIRTSILISLAYGSNLLSISFARKDLRSQRKRIKQIIDGELIGKATADVMQAIQAAAAMAAIMPVVITTT